MPGLETTACNLTELPGHAASRLSSTEPECHGAQAGKPPLCGFPQLSAYGRPQGP